MLFSSISLKCTLTILKYASHLIKYEFYLLDLTSLSNEDDPKVKLKEIINDYVKNGLKMNKNALLFINLNEIQEISSKNTTMLKKFDELLIILASLENGYEIGNLIYKDVLEEFIQNIKNFDNYKQLNYYHHLHILKEKLAKKIRIVFNMDVNHFLKNSLKHQCSNSFLANFHDFFKNYTKFYIYIKNIGENLSENDIFSINIEKIINFNRGNSEFLKNIQTAYVFEIEESKILLKETKSFNNLMSFQQFFTLVSYTYEKIRINLVEKFEKEKHSGVMGKIFDLQNAKFEKFNKDINKVIGEKEKLEKELVENEIKNKELMNSLIEKKHDLEKILENTLKIKEEIKKDNFLINDEKTRFLSESNDVIKGLIEEHYDQV